VRISTKRPVDGLDGSSVIERYTRTRAGTRGTPDKQTPVQSVQERVAAPPSLI
jgi:hypothetical protein